MPKTFLVSDHHFGHAKTILDFKRSDGSPLRDFPSAEAMNEFMVARHNAVVSPDDKVYFLGDVAMAHKNLHYLGRMNGRKVLIKGNHDVAKPDHYTPYFYDVRATHTIAGLILSHIPLHPQSLYRWKANVHGHLHDRVVLDANGRWPDPRYINVSVEQLDYTPISLDDVLKIAVKRGLVTLAA
jgi:calcineurin-like phosphoesterase family protein